MRFWNLVRGWWIADMTWCRVCGKPADSDGPFCSDEHRQEYDDARWI